MLRFVVYSSNALGWTMFVCLALLAIADVVEGRFEIGTVRAGISAILFALLVTKP